MCIFNLCRNIKDARNIKGYKSDWISTVGKKKMIHLDIKHRRCIYCSVWIAVSITICLLHVNAELVLLVTAHVRITHEVQCVVMDAHGWCNKVQFHLQRGMGGVRDNRFEITASSKSSNHKSNRITGGLASPTFAFCWSVSLLMEIRLLDLGSPITTHQPSSRFCIDKTVSISVKIIITCEYT